MKKSILIGIFLIFNLIILPISYGEYLKDTRGKKEKEVICSKEKIELKLAMRKLWEDHITYTRNYIISSLSGLEDVEKVAERLLKNQDEIGDAIKPYYGEEAGKKLARLLRDHILIATEVVQAAKIANNEDLANAQNKWRANADDIAIFLGGANPNWSKENLADMLHKHLDFTTDEVVSRLKKNWSKDIEAYDKGHLHMLMFADALTKGIVQQFPENFFK